jgi:membrane-associated phospholipid phosphatase
LQSTLKNIFAIDRPALVAAPHDSYAFPSGHAAMNTLFAGLLVLFCLPGLKPVWQKVLLSTATVFIALVCLSRLYLNVHWLTDIIGGLLLGWFVCSLAYLIFLYRPFRAPQPHHLLIATALAFLINTVIWFTSDWQARMASYQLITP